MCIGFLLPCAWYLFYSDYYCVHSVSIIIRRHLYHHAIRAREGKKCSGDMCVVQPAGLFESFLSVSTRRERERERKEVRISPRSSTRVIVIIIVIAVVVVIIAISVFVQNHAKMRER